MLRIVGIALSLSLVHSTVDEVAEVRSTKTILDYEEVTTSLYRHQDSLETTKEMKKEASMMYSRREKQLELAEYGVYIGQEMTVQATAYTPYCEGCSGITKTGLDVRHGDHNIIAVDTKVIPLKTTVELYHNGESLGVYRAEDTGGVIKGNIVDVLHKTKNEARTFGRKKGVVVRVISLPD